ncbi:MAG: hypothetical protein HC895_04615, partial [Leptolyngbyaceae cyanobacterium SM1_3_5]|nr:hypothetical protein [Leptolyngbyaceae cyanobacterium SM1_3_5]
RSDRACCSHSSAEPAASASRLAALAATLFGCAGRVFDRWQLPRHAILPASTAPIIEGEFEVQGEQDYRLTLADGTVLQVVTLEAEIDRQLQTLPAGQRRLQGRVNRSGNWLLVEQLADRNEP